MTFEYSRCRHRRRLLSLRLNLTLTHIKFIYCLQSLALFCTTPNLSFTFAHYISCARCSVALTLKVLQLLKIITNIIPAHQCQQRNVWRRLLHYSSVSFSICLLFPPWQGTRKRSQIKTFVWISTNFQMIHKERQLFIALKSVTMSLFCSLNIQRNLIIYSHSLP